MTSLRQPKRIPHNFVDLTGQRFHRLVVQGYGGVGPAGASWRCLCDCGAATITNATKLRNGRTKSCGCHKRDMAMRGVHGDTKGGEPTTEYETWKHMKRRCHNPDDHAYKDYGGRGISVCDRWRNNFRAFLADMGRKPSPRHSIDRFPDNNGNYEPGNCRWATPKQQANNRRPAKRKK